ncbi:hypothetical protein GQX74_004330 [Glossina fuscipes]|nr:hypothetical protein GQX74_004330 [Glossina fuscipes]
MYPRFFLLGNLADKRKKYSSRRNNLPRTYECISASILCSLSQDDVLQVLNSVCGSSVQSPVLSVFLLPVISEPPLCAGTSQSSVTLLLVISGVLKFCGGDGGAV